MKVQKVMKKSKNSTDSYEFLKKIFFRSWHAIIFSYGVILKGKITLFWEETPVEAF
jgi:hypothetical protein